MKKSVEITEQASLENGTPSCIPVTPEKKRRVSTKVLRRSLLAKSILLDNEHEENFAIVAEQDILGLPFPSEYGGTGTGTLMLNMAVEEIAKVDASCALILMVQELGTLPIQLFGSDDLKERFLPKCASGEWSPAFALSEPEAGSDPAGMKTTAVRDGDDWVINGSKNWISNLGIADFWAGQGQAAGALAASSSRASSNRAP